jgi:23S rRNA pseudouridine2605 synthase
MERFGCVVNRLIRTNYGPFELGNLPLGTLIEIPPAHVVRFMDGLRKRGVEV